MALAAGTDYLLVHPVAYAGCEGTGRSCLAATKNILLMVPVETQIVVQRRLRTTEWDINGDPPWEAIRNEAMKEGTDLARFETFLRLIPDSVEPSILHDLNTVSRLRIRTGLLSRGVYVSENLSGAGWRGYALKKKEALLFRKFFTGHHALVH